MLKFFACCKSKTVTDARTEVMVAVPVQDYHQILNKMQEKGQKFEDPLFPPNRGSLSKNLDDEEDEYANYEWKRIPEVTHITERAKDG